MIEFYRYKDFWTLWIWKFNLEVWFGFKYWELSCHFLSCCWFSFTIGPIEFRMAR